jgi:hypothetical protein
MKKLFATLSLVLIMGLFSPRVHAWDLSDLLNGVSGNSSSKTEQTKDTTGKKSGGLGDLLSGVANALGAGSKSLTIEKLAGTWTYESPAVTFKSDNLLLKAGGAAAASQVENKLAPYYRTAGLTNLVVTIANDSTFTFQARKATVKGTIEKNAETGNFVFKFKALKKINLGSMEAFIVMNGDKMDLTFDVSKLMTLLERVGTLTNNSSVKTVSAMLNQYDGMTAGFTLKR